MATATLHLSEVGGWPGPAMCWKLDPPKAFGGFTAEYVVTCIVQEFPYQNAEVFCVPADESGACVDPSRSVRKRGGSITLHETPDTPDYVAGAHWFALQGLGGYNAQAAPPEEPETP